MEVEGGCQLCERTRGRKEIEAEKEKEHAKKASKGFSLDGEHKPRSQEGAPPSPQPHWGSHLAPGLGQSASRLPAYDFPPSGPVVVNIRGRFYSQSIHKPWQVYTFVFLEELLSPDPRQGHSFLHYQNWNGAFLTLICSTSFSQFSLCLPLNFII